MNDINRISFKRAPTLSLKSCKRKNKERQSHAIFMSFNEMSNLKTLLMLNASNGFWGVFDDCCIIDHVQTDSLILDKPFFNTLRADAEALCWMVT